MKTGREEEKDERIEGMVGETVGETLGNRKKEKSHYIFRIESMDCIELIKNEQI